MWAWAVKRTKVGEGFQEKFLRCDPSPWSACPQGEGSRLRLAHGLVRRRCPSLRPPRARPLTERWRSFVYLSFPVLIFLRCPQVAFLILSNPCSFAKTARETLISRRGSGRPKSIGTWPGRCATAGRDGTGGVSMQVFRRLRAALITLLLLPAVLPGSAAYAQAPSPWEMGMQPAFSPVKQQIIDLHDLVLVIITLITLFVGGLAGLGDVSLQRQAQPGRRATPCTTRCWRSPGR